jgi:opacity protein-like surface antigen
MRSNLGKKFFVPALLVCFTARASAQTDVSYKFELRVFAGLSMTHILESSNYADEWKLELLSKITEQNLISAKSGNAFSLGAFLSCFLRPNFALEAGLGFFRADVPNTTAYHVDYTWLSGANAGQSAKWTGSGDLRVIPITLNAFGRTRKGKIEAYGSAGLTLFWNAFQSAGRAGFSVSDVAYVLTYTPPSWEKTVNQTVDALPVSLEIAKHSWLAPGLNVGGGIDYRLSDKIGLTAGFRYFLCPEKEFEWTWKPGFYNGLGNIISDWEFTSDNAKYAESKTTPLFKVNPSFLQLGLGIKLFL